jgi:isopentenyl-diphosphate delta-isomerase type 2
VDISSTVGAGFELVRFEHEALPELDLDEIDAATSFLGTDLALPLMISCMTGGTHQGRDANRDLAIAAQACGVAVGLGSMRVGLENPDVLDHFSVKDVAPDVPVVANLAAAQLREIDHDRIADALDHLRVQAIALHLNPGQELFQPDGDRSFRGLEAAIAAFTERCPLPVIVKETGFGISVSTALRLLDAGVDYVDVAGAGGTNWVLVEAQRLDDADADADAARELADWGNPTAAVLAAMRDEPRLSGSIIASGGLRRGQDVAKAIALGAEIGALALPFIKDVFAGGAERVAQRIRLLGRVLRSIMLLTGSRTLEDLRRARVSIDPTLTGIGSPIPADSIV